MPLSGRPVAVTVMVGLLLGQVRASAQTPRPSAQETARCTQAFEHGQEQRQQGQLRAARSSFEVCARPVCPAVVGKVCVRWLDELRTQVPRLSVQARGVDGATVLLDGEPAGPAPASLEVDPGPHRVGARTARGDGPVVEVTVAASSTAAVTVEGPPEPAPPARASVAVEPPSAGGHRVLGYGLFGLGALSFGAGAWLGLATRADVEDRRKACAANADDCTTPAGRDRLRTRLNVADALMGTGLVAGGLGLFFFLRSGPAVQVSSRPGGASAAATFRF